MINVISEKMNQTVIPPSADNIDQVLALLLQKENEIEQLKQALAIPSVNNPSYNVVSEFQDTIFNLKKSISQLELDLLQLRKDWEKLSQKLEIEITHIASDHRKIHEEYAAINKARMEVIRQQQFALNVYKLLSIRHRLKNFFRPRIGVLHQYPAQIFSTPKRYLKPINLINTPLISIVTPSFNQGKFLEQTITSVVHQKYPALEYVIQDAASEDETIEILKRYESSLKHWESKKDKGQSNALNLGFRHTSGEIMAYLNSDDILLPGTLNYVANYFDKHPDVDVVYGHRVLIDENDQEVGRWVLPPHDSNVLTWADYIPQETLFWRRRIWDKAGGYIDESFKFAMDWDLLLRFKDAGAKFVRLPRFLGAFRVHQHQKTSNQIAELGMKEMERLRMRCHGRRVSHAEIKRHLLTYVAKHFVCHKLFRAGIFRY